MFQVAYTYNTTNSAECRLFGLSELNFIDELRKEQASQPQHYAFSGSMMILFDICQKSLNIQQVSKKAFFRAIKLWLVIAQSL